MKRYCEQGKRTTELLEEQRISHTQEADAEKQQIQDLNNDTAIESDNGTAVAMIENMQAAVAGNARLDLTAEQAEVAKRKDEEEKSERNIGQLELNNLNLSKEEKIRHDDLSLALSKARAVNFEDDRKIHALSADGRLGNNAAREANSDIQELKLRLAGKES